MQVTYKEALITCTTEEFLELCKQGLFSKSIADNKSEQSHNDWRKQGTLLVTPVYGCVVDSQTLLPEEINDSGTTETIKFTSTTGTIKK